MASVSFTFAQVDGHPCAWLAGDNSVQVAGESYHQDHIEVVVKYLGLHNPFSAWLVPETENPADENAVAVYVGNGKVGYLPRDMAARWQWVIREIESESGARVACAGKFFASEGAQDWVRGSRQIEVLLTLPHPPKKPPKTSGMLADAPAGGLNVGVVMLDAKCPTCGAMWRLELEQLDSTAVRPCSHPFAFSPADLLLLVEQLRALATATKARLKKKP